MNPQESPEYVRTSTAAAMTLGIFPGKFNRGERLDALNLLLTYDDGCKANCGYCGLSSSRDPEEDSFIRVDWPTLEMDDVIKRTKDQGKHLQRVCVSMITHHRAFDDMCTIMSRFRDDTDLLISGLIAPSLIHDMDKMNAIKDAGADKIGVAVDAVTPELFEKFRGAGVKGPHKWDHYWNVVKWGAECFGRGNVGVHLIVGLGETEQEMISTIQYAEDMGAKTHLFSFYPEGGSEMQDWSPPAYSAYRRVQLARYLINEDMGNILDMKFNEKGQLVDFGQDVEEVIIDGEAFMTSGCSGHDGHVACNRPYGNERPSRPIRNYAFKPEASDIETVRAQLADYSEELEE